MYRLYMPTSILRDVSTRTPFHWLQLYSNSCKTTDQYKARDIGDTTGFELAATHSRFREGGKHCDDNAFNTEPGQSEDLYC